MVAKMVAKKMHNGEKRILLYVKYRQYLRQTKDAFYVYKRIQFGSMSYYAQQDFSTRNVNNSKRGSSAVECRTRNQVSPGSNPPLVPFRRLGIFVLSINAPVDSAV